MKSTASKWLLGCGIGCGVIILIGVIVCSGGYFLIKDTVKGFQEAELVMDELEEELGYVDDYIPPLNGKIASERMEVFLAVRDSIQPAGEDLSESITNLSANAIRKMDKEEESFKGVMGLVGKGLSLVPQISDYMRKRNEILLKQRMSIGEYGYIYILSYYSLLGKSMRDGPEFQLNGGSQSRDGFSWRDDRNDYSREDARDARERSIRRMTRRFMTQVLENCLEEIDRGPDSQSVNRWRREIEAELARLDDDNSRIPWEDTLPVTLTRSLEPYEKRLEAAYLPMLSSIEMQGVDHR